MEFTDPDGPRLWRLAPYALPALALTLALNSPLPASTRFGLFVASILAFVLVGLVGTRQRRPRAAELVCGPGYVEVRRSGTRNQRISAKDVTGATTARTSKGVVITLQHRARIRPITLEVESEADAERVRHALGIGHGGFGTIAWHTEHPSQRRAQFARVLAIVGLALVFGTLLVNQLFGSLDALGILTGVTGFLTLTLAALIGLVSQLSSFEWPSIVMTPEGLRLRTPRGWFALPYEGVQHIEPKEKAVVFHVPPPYMRVAVTGDSTWLGGLSPYERETLVSQITAAAQRARGLGPEKKDVLGRVEILRRHGESPRDWLVRLDMAGQLLASGSGYRGNTLDTEDLWTVLEDPEADPEIRAAAARVLRHLPAPETRTRIEAAVAAVRDEATSLRLRIAVRDDLDLASKELSYLDALEPASVQMPAAGAQPAYGRSSR